MKLKAKPLALTLAASAIVCGASVLPAQAATPTSPAQTAPSAQGSALKTTDKRVGIDDDFVASRVDIDNETGEPIAFKYDSDGSGQGRGMNFINEDGTPVTPYSSRKVDSGYVAPFWIETHTTSDTGALLAYLDTDAEVDLYPIGVWSGTRYKPIRIRGNDERGWSSRYNWISADYTQGSTESSRSSSHVDSTDLWTDLDGWSDALGITKQPLVLPALPATK